MYIVNYTNICIKDIHKNHSFSAMEFSLEELDHATAGYTSVIGEGAFGTVYLGTNIRHSGTSVAVKVLNEV